MAVEGFRQSKRRECERRLDERRLVGFLFGSTEWRQNIEKQYLMWPRMDRRSLDRRALERRNISRRQSTEVFTKRQPIVKKNNARDILTTDEKAMLAGLFHPGEPGHD